MSRHDYAVLTLRAFALYIWFCALQYLTSGVLETGAFYFEKSGGDTSFHYYMIIAFCAPAIIYTALGFFLFARSAPLASWLMPRPGEPGVEQLPTHPLAAASVAFGAIGVAIFLHALPGVLNPVLTYLQQRGDPYFPNASLSHADEGRVIAASVQMVLGFALFLKARTLATVWWHKQQEGQPGE